MEVCYPLLAFLWFLYLEIHHYEVYSEKITFIFQLETLFSIFFCQDCLCSLLPPIWKAHWLIR